GKLARNSWRPPVAVRSTWCWSVDSANNSSNSRTPATVLRDVRNRAEDALRLDRRGRLLYSVRNAITGSVRAARPAVIQHGNAPAIPRTRKAARYARGFNVLT